MNPVIFTVGRFNPVTRGHLSLFYHMQNLAGTAQLRVFTTKSQDAQRNPLTPDQKLAFMKELFPRLPVSVTDDVMSALHALHAEGFTHAVMVAGEDRVASFANLARAVNAGKTDCPIKMMVQTNKRPPTMPSGTLARQCAQAGDFAGFAATMPCKSQPLIEKIYQAVRLGMGA